MGSAQSRVDGRLDVAGEFAGLTALVIGGTAGIGVRVNTVTPGPTRASTVVEIIENFEPQNPTRTSAQTPAVRPAEAEEVANVVTFLVPAKGDSKCQQLQQKS